MLVYPKEGQSAKCAVGAKGGFAEEISCMSPRDRTTELGAEPVAQRAGE